MSLDVARVRKAIAANLSAISEVNVNAYAMAQPTPPGLQILPPSVTFDQSMQRGFDLWTFTVQGFVSLTGDVAPQMLLDELCAPAGPRSVKAALESDPTLDGLVSDASITEQTPGRVLETAGGSPMLVVEWNVQVWASGV
jgi:hypothetical protein